MTPYPAYRETRSIWLSHIPVHWEDERAKHCFLEIDHRSQSGTEELLSVSHISGVTPRSEKDVTMFMAESYVGHKLCQPGDLVINSMWAWMGAAGISAYHGIVSPAYGVYRLKQRDLFEPKYLDYLLRTKGYAGEYLCRSNGIWTSRLLLTPSDFFDVPILRPPRDEQDAIVAFLDRKLAEIDRFIAAKERLIALLREQKAAIINRAVTRGLDPDVPMRPSGIEWLGEIPAHWEVRRAKYYFAEVDERSTTGAEELLSVSHITGVTPRSEKNITMFMAESYEGSKTCQPGDLVINIMWAWMGAAGVSQHSGIVSSSYGVYRLRRDDFAWRYLDQLVRSKPYVAEYTCRSTGITSSRLRMYTEDFFGIPMICPPLAEQEQILQHIDEESATLDHAIARAQREIELIKEFRTTLIADAVTGKIDVRSAVPAVVEEVPV